MSTLKIYQCELTPEKNALIEGIDSYLLNKTTYTSTNFQYIQLDLDIKIKVNLSQDFAAATSIGNYVSINQDNKTWYYFITSAKWRAKNTVELSLSIDSVNTFKEDFTFTDKTHITRQHKNRFSNTSPLIAGHNTLYYDVDDKDEGISGAVQYKISDTTIYSGNRWLNQHWYLVYESDVDAAKGIKCTLYPEKAVPVASLDTSGNILPTDLANYNEYHYVSVVNNTTRTTINFNNRTFTLGQQYSSGTIISFSYWKSNDIGHVDQIEIAALVSQDGKSGTWKNLNGTLNGSTYANQLKLIEASHYNKSFTVYNTLADIERLTEYDYDQSASTVTKCQDISSVVRTSDTIVKIIELPYAPADFTWNGYDIKLPLGWSLANNGSKYYITPDIETEFGATILHNQELGLTKDYFIGLLPGDTEKSVLLSKSKDLNLEPKLLHSSLYTYKLVYDSYSTQIPFEKISVTPDNLPLLNIEYKQSNTISSNLGFKYDLKNVSYTESGDYSKYLIATRNNESPIYNNAYISYLRTGYNYDRKAQTTQNQQTWWSFGIQLVGAGISVAAAIPTGGLSIVAAAALGTSAIGSFASAIASTAKSEQTIEAKLAELKAQATAVSGSDDLNLLNWYNGNKLHIMEYQISDKLKDLMSQTFYYFGYANDSYGIPNYNSRTWFNYIQCEPRFQEETTSIYQDYVADIKARYAAGVTVYHRVNNTWDLNQTKENWETVLIPA